jgi:hypothetical protein
MGNSTVSAPYILIMLMRLVQGGSKWKVQGLIQHAHSQSITIY